jgi:aminoglycoside phosphotransferase (APT) family kinase protein
VGVACSQVTWEISDMSLTHEEVVLVCASLLGVQVDAVEFPGGARRESVRVKVAGQALIVTRRRSQRRAQLECGVLRALNQRDAPVPRLIASRDNVLIQQDAGPRRLAQSLHLASPGEAAVLLESALESLYRIHRIAQSSEALQSVVVLGNGRNWLDTFARSAQRLGTQLQHPAPELQVEKLIALLKIERPLFIKWDARPGNAVVRENGRILWIDWEHCGRRHPLDDMAWLLADEYTPENSSVENDMIPRLLPYFAHGLSQQQASEYFHVYAVLHSCIRLAMIMKHQQKDGWRDFDQCLALDKVGVVKALAVRVSERASRWAQHSPLTKSLQPWFAELSGLIKARP